MRPHPPPLGSLPTPILPSRVPGSLSPTEEQAQGHTSLAHLSWAKQRRAWQHLQRSCSCQPVCMTEHQEGPFQYSSLEISGATDWERSY
ncbi:hypothetical protein LEMLEM_LOCUS10864, partial [Lemmus lemmus]